MLMTTLQRGFEVEMIHTRWTRDITNRCIYITVHELSFTCTRTHFRTSTRTRHNKYL